jgi:hypothetical protein
MEKIQLLKKIRDCELKGIQFDTFYTIDHSMEELKFASEWGQTQLADLALATKARQVCELSGLGLEQIDPEFSKSPLNPKNWGSDVWNMMNYYSSGKYLFETKTKTESPNEYNTILNIPDENSNPISINLVLHKTIGNKFEAEIYDSTRRYFYSCELEQDFNYYYNKAISNQLDIRYCYSQHLPNQITIYLCGGGYDDMVGLEEIIESDLHLETQLNKLKESENQYNQIQTNIEKISPLYPNQIQIQTKSITDNLNKDKDKTKVAVSIDWLYELLKDFENDDQMFKKIGDFIKYLEE